MNQNQIERGHPASLSSLAAVELSRSHQALLEAAQDCCGGSVVWRRRKIREARDVLALAGISGRLYVRWLDLAGDLKLLIDLEATVPCRPGPDAPIRVARGARLGVTYREEGMRLPQPGYSFAQILCPRSVFHPNVSGDPAQVLCLGTLLPVGIPMREVILMAYGALTLQSVQLDPGNAAGVMNPAAADWWQRNAQDIPLSNEPFIRSQLAPPAQQV